MYMLFEINKKKVWVRYLSMDEYLYDKRRNFNDLEWHYPEDIEDPTNDIIPMEGTEQKGRPTDSSIPVFGKEHW
jgi:hypothetical protein